MYFCWPAECCEHAYIVQYVCSQPARDAPAQGHRHLLSVCRLTHKARLTSWSRRLVTSCRKSAMPFRSGHAKPCRRARQGQVSLCECVPAGTLKAAAAEERTAGCIIKEVHDVLSRAVVHQVACNAAQEVVSADAPTTCTAQRSSLVSTQTKLWAHYVLCPGVSICRDGSEHIVGTAAARRGWSRLSCGPIKQICVL